MAALRPPRGPAAPIEASNVVIRKRSPPGTIGTRVMLKSNCFDIEWRVPVIYRHVVEFDPEIPAQQMVRRRLALGFFNRALNEAYGTYAFDGASILCLKRVDQPMVFRLPNKAASISLRPTKAVSTSSVADLERSEVNTIINIILKKFLRIENLVKIGRAYYKPTPILVPEVSLCIYRGVEASVEASVTGMQLNIGVIHRIVRQKTVRDVMDEIEASCWERFGNLPQNQVLAKIDRQVQERLKGASVLTSYNKMLWRIDYVDWDRTVESTFDLKDRSTVTFRKYYQDKYNLKIDKVKDGLLVHVPRRQKTKDDLVLLIPEFCHLTGLTDRERSNYRLMKILSDKTRLEPSRRLGFVKSLVKDISTNPKLLEEMKPLPFVIQQQEKTFVGRVLGPYRVQVKSHHGLEEVVMQGRNLNFGNTLRRSGMVQLPPKVVRWVVCVEQRDAQLGTQFIQEMAKMTRSMGCANVLAAPKLAPMPFQRGLDITQQWTRHLQKLMTSFNPQLIVCLINERPPQIYGAVKGFCTTNAGVVSQCILTKSMRNPKKIVPILSNTLKQILTKLGGTPWSTCDWVSPRRSVVLTQQPTMVVGIDVCHDRKAGYSTVGFTASYSRDFSQYLSFVAYQEAGKEILETGEELMYRALKTFGSYHPFPTNILVFRDGVSSGQLLHVLNQEVRSFKKAFVRIAQLKAGYQPKLTVVVVQKRVSARFITQQGSPPPGTVVDTHVVSPLFNDFYLVPCEAHPNVGTATPTRFIVVYDDMGFHTDDIQSITMQFCFMYFNWPGPVRVPAPCMYAHKIAYLLGKHIPGQKSPKEQLQGKLFYL